MIRLKGVNKYFNKGKRNEIHVINDTTLELEPTGLVALLGPSGSGKTTLLNAIGGLDKADSGEIFVDGERITSKSASGVDEIRNLKIGYIFQDYKLVDNMTVYENVAMVLRMIGIKDEAEIRKRIEYILETLGIYRYRNRMADMLSGGERQRVGIARAIAKNPKIIIADEPTGNLDSANTIEIMNIIKAISRDRLVVLVTHEVELAKFYASRIIELKDGKIINDYANQTDDNLDYRIDNRIYLKDLEKHSNVRSEDMAIDFYGSADDRLDLKIVVRNGNIYIKTANDQRIEVVDSNSAVEFVDDHYREIDKTLYESYDFDFDKVADTSIKERYSSIISFPASVAKGFKKIGTYPLIKKLLFIGFMLAGVFITYALSSIYASLDVQDEDFIQKNRDYMTVETPAMTVDAFTEYENMAQVDYIFPVSSVASFNFKMDFYYQTEEASASLSGSLTDMAQITGEDLICGRLPDNSHEIVVDKLVIDRMFQSDVPKQVGITQAQQMIGQKVEAYPMDDFQIVGITDTAQPVIYADTALFTDILYSGYIAGSMYADQTEISQTEAAQPVMWDYATYGGDITVTSGHLPENDYEVLVPVSMAEGTSIGRQIDASVNGQKLTVTGYYEDNDASGKESTDFYLVNENTIKYDMITDSRTFDIASHDKEAMMGILTEDGYSVQSAYDADKKDYMDDRQSQTSANILICLIIMAISLIEILLMTRSSFLSRIKEIGIYRAIGVKKTDIYKMFLGEIIAITTVSSLVGIIIMSYIFYHLCQISMIAQMFAINPVVIGGAVAIVYVFNSIVGLIPVFNTMRKTPAAILSRHDVD